MGKTNVSIRSLLRKVFAFVFHDEFTAHRIPFGPMAGFIVYMKPSISPRMYLGIDENDLAESARRLIRENDCVYDVGAHIGYTSILFSMLVGKGGNVEAFELLPSTVEIFKKTMMLNEFKQWRVHTVGLGNCERKISVSRGLTYMGSIYNHAQSQGRMNDEECKVVSLDKYINTTNLPLPQFIKMDIEGAELEALQGAIQVILIAEPILLIEFHSLELLKKGVSWLNNVGYILQSLSSGETFTIESVTRLNNFHQTVLSYRPDCNWHKERMGL